MIFVLIVNVIVIVLSMLDLSEDINAICDILDTTIVYIYVSEFVIKFIGLGFEKYFDDNWNIFDFAMIILMLSTSIVSRLLTVIKNAKLLRISKLNRVIKLFNGLRSIKVFNVLIIGAETIN
jgi:hypothetical protein